MSDGEEELKLLNRLIETVEMPGECRVDRVFIKLLNRN